MNWIVPSAAWCTEMRTIMDTFGLCMNDAWRLLREHGTADDFFDHLTQWVLPTQYDDVRLDPHHI